MPSILSICDSFNSRRWSASIEATRSRSMSLNTLRLSRSCILAGVNSFEFINVVIFKTAAKLQRIFHTANPAAKKVVTVVTVIYPQPHTPYYIIIYIILYRYIDIDLSGNVVRLKLSQLSQLTSNHPPLSNAHPLKS